MLICVFAAGLPPPPLWVSECLFESEKQSGVETQEAARGGEELQDWGMGQLLEDTRERGHTGMGR